MEKYSATVKFLRFFYQQIYVRFNQKIREPYLICVDRVYNAPETNELSVAFHVVNKRICDDMTVANFVKKDMLYLIDPRIVFDMGEQFGAHSERLNIVQKKKPDFKNKCIAGLKRIFVDG